MPEAALFDDLPDAKPIGENLFDDIPDAKPTIGANVFSDIPDDPDSPRAKKRKAMDAEMVKLRSEGAALEAVTRTIGEIESTVYGIRHPIEQAEKATEAVASDIAGQPLQIIEGYKPSTIIENADKLIPRIPMIPQQETAAAQVAAGSVNAISEFVNSFATVEGASTLGIGLLPQAAKQAMLRTFAAQMLIESPQNIIKANEAAARGDMQEAAKFAMAGGGEALLSSTMARHATQKPVVKETLVRADAADQAPKAIIEQAVEVAEKSEVLPETAEALRRTEGLEEKPPEPLPTTESPIAEARTSEQVAEPTEQVFAPSGITMPTDMPAGAPMIRASEIIKDLADLMERPIRVGHISQTKAAGIFKPVLEVARIKRANDIPVATHEIAHGLERTHRRALGGLSRRAWTMSLPANVRAELQGLDYNPKARRAYEGFAEFVRHYLTLGDTATVAPNSHAWFEGTFLKDNPQLREGMASARQKIVQFQAQGAVNRVRSMVQMLGEETKKPISTRIIDAKNRFIARWADDLRPLELVEKEILDGGTALGAESPTKIARTVTQKSGARARLWAKYRMTDFAGNKTGPSLQEIFSRKGIKGDEMNAILYAVAKRSTELHQRGVNAGIERVDADYAVNQLRTPEREAFASEIRDWNAGALDYLREAGGISQEAFDNITAQNQAYIPFFRVFEEQLGSGFSAGGRRIGDTPQPIKRLKGSGREIKDPIGAMQQHANQIIAVADKIRVARELVRLVESKEGFGRFVEEIPADKVPVEFDINRIASQLRAAGADLSQAQMDAVMTMFTNSQRNPSGANIVSFVRNGKRKFYELDPDLYRALQAVDYKHLHPALDWILGKPARAIRLGATGVRAGFTLITNPIRDFTTAMIQTEGNPFKSAALTAKHMGKQLGMSDSEIKNLWRATGGEITQPLGLDRTSLKRSIDDVLANSAGRKAMHIIRHPVEFVRNVLSFTEAAPRLAEYEMTLREMGWKPGQKVTENMAIEAANRAAEVTLNFSRAGSWGRQMNQAVAFFNPSIQGLSKFTRAHKENPTAAALKGAAIITAPAVINWMINKDDPEWRNLPTWVKYGFLNFKIGGEWIRIPTPFEWWYAYGVAPTSLIDAFYTKSPEPVQKAVAESLEKLSPPVIPSVATPILEAGFNRSFYTGKPIVSEGEKQLATTAQAKPWTSETSRKISEILSVGGVEVAPSKIEHVLHGETGGLWTDIIGIAERSTGIAPSKEAGEPADIPVVGRLFVRDSASEVIDTLYTELMDLRGKDAAFKKFIKQGEDKRADKYELTPEEAAKLKVLEDAAEKLSKLRKELVTEKNRAERKKLMEDMKAISEAALDIAK